MCSIRRYLSDYIDIGSCIKQGGLMSPVLYNIYVNDLMKKLKAENLGCKLCNENYEQIFMLMMLYY